MHTILQIRTIIGIMTQLVIHILNKHVQTILEATPAPAAPYVQLKHTIRQYHDKHTINKCHNKHTIKQSYTNDPEGDARAGRAALGGAA